MSETHVIDGVRYVPIRNSTVEHDVYLMGKISKSGLDEVTIKAGESPESWSRRFLFRCMASGEAMCILGALFVPEEIGEAGWTPAIAEQTARAFGSITNEDDKQAVFGLLLTTLIGFFELGLTSVVSSQTS